MANKHNSLKKELLKRITGITKEHQVSFLEEELNILYYHKKYQALPKYIEGKLAK